MSRDEVDAVLSELDGLLDQVRANVTALQAILQDDPEVPR